MPCSGGFTSLPSELPRLYPRVAVTLLVPSVSLYIGDRMFRGRTADAATFQRTSAYFVTRPVTRFCAHMRFARCIRMFRSHPFTAYLRHPHNPQAAVGAMRSHRPPPPCCGALRCCSLSTAALGNPLNRRNRNPLDTACRADAPVSSCLTSHRSEPSGIAVFGSSKPIDRTRCIGHPRPNI
jgi:hypothetical protein